MIPSDERAMLRDAAIAWTRDNAPLTASRALRSDADLPGFDPALYRAMAEMGWAGITVPEADGGFDFGLASLGLLPEQLGRTLVASPLIGSAAIGTGALVLAGTPEQRGEWLPAIVAGGTIVALALDEGARHDPAGTALAARRDGDEWVLSGTKRPVFDSTFATHPDARRSLLLVTARTSGVPGNADGITLFLCDSNAPGVTATPLRQIDSRAAAIFEFTGCRLPDRAVLGPVDQGLPLLDRILDRGRAVLAAEMLGSATQAFETTIEYLKTRVQFDHPIGSFQALQHRAAEVLGEIELTRSAVTAALAAIDNGTPDDSGPDEARLVSLAKATAGQCLRHVAQDMIQLHGGIGMTDEHDAGLYLKRAQVADMTLGNVAFHRDR